MSFTLERKFEIPVRYFQEAAKMQRQIEERAESSHDLGQLEAVMDQARKGEADGD